MLYEMITDQTPFRGPTPSDVIAEILKSEPPLFRKSPTTLPAPLISVLRNTLCKSPDGRYQTADEAVEQLQRLLRGLIPSHVKSPFKSACSFLEELHYLAVRQHGLGLGL